MNAHRVRGWRPRGTVRSASNQRLNGTKSGNAKIEKGNKMMMFWCGIFLFNNVEKKSTKYVCIYVGDKPDFFFFFFQVVRNDAGKCTKMAF